MSTVDRSLFESMIPHKGLMCLLDQVISWDENRIYCTSMSHTRLNNPLRKNNKLSAIHALEYGAQAMAVHGGLIASAKGIVIMPGYLAAVRNIKMSGQILSDLDSGLDICANLILSEGGNLVYQFDVSHCNLSLMSGRITIIEMEG